MTRGSRNLTARRGPICHRPTQNPTPHDHGENWSSRFLVLVAIVPRPTPAAAATAARKFSIPPRSASLTFPPLESASLHFESRRRPRTLTLQRGLAGEEWGLRWPCRWTRTARRTAAPTTGASARSPETVSPVPILSLPLILG